MPLLDPVTKGKVVTLKGEAARARYAGLRWARPDAPTRAMRGWLEAPNHDDRGASGLPRFTTTRRSNG